LDSLLESLKGELDDCDVIICDNGSTETNMQRVLERWKNTIKLIQLKGGDWINDEYKAKNALLKCCLSEYAHSSILFLQDDMQYVGPIGQLSNIAMALDTAPFINISVTGVRKSTIASVYSSNRISNVWQLKDNHIGTTGLFKASLFQDVGSYVDNYPTVKEFWGRGEDDYHERVMKKFGNGIPLSGFAHVPVFAGIWNDPRGHYSFLRNGKRYGHYLPPYEKTYYRHMAQAEYDNLLASKIPAGFSDIAHPIGWSYAKTPDGDQFKYSQAGIMSEGPVSDII
jgi:hypothetical protein